MAHTSTPWRVEVGTTLIWGACDPENLSTYGMGYPIVDAKYPSSWAKGRPREDEQMANAEFIALACNSHDALVAAVEGLLAITGRIVPAKDYEERISKARAALEAAKS